MVRRNLHVARSEKQIRQRLIAMLNQHSPAMTRLRQTRLFASASSRMLDERFELPSYSVVEFLNFLRDALPTGNVYLFGGILRDLAMFGRKGFASDIDLVVDGEWGHVQSYLRAVDASLNRFGGFRLIVDGWPIDLWSAQDTWAIRRGLVQYTSIWSLTKTTILNWDAILLNWDTKRILCGHDYFTDVQERTMDIVLAENPNPLGAVIRAFRHLCMNDAKKITLRAAKYLCTAAQQYSTREIVQIEASSHYHRVIDPTVIRFFREVDTSSDRSIRLSFSNLSNNKKIYGATNVEQPRLI